MSIKASWGRGTALAWSVLLGGALAGGVVGCDDAEDNPSEIWSIGFAELPAQLACVDDLDRATDDRLEYDLKVAVSVARIPSAPLQVRLSAVNGAFEPRVLPVPIKGEVTFASVALPLGALGLTVELLEGDEVRASATGSLVAAIDTADPDCPEAPPGLTLRFNDPVDMAVLTAADDDDGDLGNGLQTEVTVGVAGTLLGAVALTVDGAPAGTVNLTNGVARFPSVDLRVGDGSPQVHQLVASLDGVEAAISVTVEVGACTLELLAPAPGMACVSDLDPEAEGVQVELVARSNCPTVTFAVDGVEQTPSPVVAGEVRQQVTLAAGQNTLTATASNGNGLTGTLAPVVIDALGTTPTVALDLDAAGDNLRNLTNTSDGAGPTWAFTGTVANVPADAAARLTWDPPLDGAPASAAVGAEGALAFAVTTAAYGCHTVTAEATDACGAIATSPAYAVCFDSVQPTVRLLEPVEGALISPAIDQDPNLPGMQVRVRLAADDTRPATVDYTLSVECGPDLAALTRRAAAEVRRSTLDQVDGFDITVAPEDAGTLLCRVRAAGDPNPAIAPVSTYTVVPVVPSFAVLVPAVGPEGAPVCLAGDLMVDGLGAELDDNGAALVAEITPEGGAPGEPVALEALGGERYTVTFGAEGGPEALPEGRYGVRVSGFAVGGALPIAVSPEGPIAVIIDRTAPAPALVSPAAGSTLGAANDLDGDLANCVQTDLTVAVADANTTEVCVRVNGAAPRCAPLDAGGQAVIAAASLVDGENLIEVLATDCAGNTAAVSAALQTDGCQPRILVQSPADGARIAASVADLDPVAPGVQLDVVLATGLALGAQVQVEVIDGALFGPVAVDADGAATVRVTLDAPAEPLDLLSYGLRGRTLDGGNLGPISDVVVLYAAPAITLRPVGDCLNAAAPDASVVAGYQVALEADTLRAAAGDAANVTANCGGIISQAAGVVDAAGVVRFAPLTLPDEAQCALTLAVTDAAGQRAESAADLRVDRIAPTYLFTAPLNGGLLNAFSDQDRAAAGIQFAPLVRVCGAAGTQVAITSPEVAALDGDTYPVPAGDCAVLTLDQVTFPEGQLTLTAQGTDTCGNPGQGLTRFTVDSDANLAIVDPTQNGIIRTSNEADPAREGCQYTLVASVIGLPAEAEFAVCTSLAQGAGPALCDGQSSAVDASNAAGCRFEGGEQALLRCPLDLREGTHDLTVAARFGEVTRSLPVRVRADCAAPTVTAITVAQAGADACVNRQERLNPDDPNDTAAVNVSFQVAGIEDGRFVDVRRAPGATRLTRVAVTGGVATGRVNLTTGQSYDLYLTGTDAAGNNLPPFALGVNGSRLRVDTRAPAPRLLNLVEAGCLNGAQDQDAGQAGLQYAVQVQPSGEVGERLALRLAVGAAERNAADVNAVQFLFEAIGIAEGPASAVVTATDACGNVGSVGGFVRVAGRDDWTQPLGVPFRVDTLPPVVALQGLDADRVYTEADDLDAEPNNGLQLELTAAIDAATIEPTSEVQFRADGQRLSTLPAVLRVPADFDGTLSAPATFPPGPLSVTAQATDACGNVGTSVPTAITVDVGGCASRITSLVGEPAILGRGDAVVDGAGLRLDVSGTVTLLDLTCAGASADLLLDGEQVLGTAVVGPDGALTFTDVRIPEGAGTLVIEVVRPGDSTRSLGQSVVVDLTAPVVTIESPAGNPALVVQDAEPGTPGQQVLVSARITEAPVGSARTATLAVDGALQGPAVAVGAGSPQLVNFTATVPPGASTLRVCVIDEAENEACADRTLDADPAPPADISPTVEILDERLTRVAFTFTMPGDDGFENGPVQGFEARRADAPINDEQTWEAATPVDGPQLPGVAPGAEARYETESLALNERHFVVIRAVDEAGRRGALVNVEVDLSLAVRTYTVPAAALPFDNSAIINVPSVVQSVGDVDGDGFDDLLAAAAQSTASGAALIFGSADPDQADQAVDVVVLQRPLLAAPNFFGIAAAALGDVNGDGAPDFGVVGFAVDFTSSLAVIYFGCPAADLGCTRADLATPDVVIRAGRLAYGLGGIGNFTQRAVDVDGGGQPVVYDDIFLGDSVPPTATNAFVIAGRAQWPAFMDASQLNLDEGRTEIRVPAGLSNGGRPGRVVFGAGDLDGDGLDDVAFSDGTAFDHTFVYYGRSDLPLSYTLDSDARNFKLEHPCRAAGTTFGSYLGGGVDLDGDDEGRPDLLVGDYVGKRVALFDQDLTAVDCLARSEGLFGVTFSVGDINGDGFHDLVANHLDTDGRPQDVLVFYNDGAGIFGQGVGLNPRVADARLRTPNQAKQGAAVAGDFNGDGRTDIAVGAIDAANGFRVVISY